MQIHGKFQTQSVEIDGSVQRLGDSTGPYVTSVSITPRAGNTGEIKWGTSPDAQNAPTWISLPYTGGPHKLSNLYVTGTVPGDFCDVVYQGQALSGSAPPLPPAAPQNLDATATGLTTIDLSWDAVSGAASYRIKRGTVDGGPYSVVASGVTGTSFGDTDLDEGTLYYYRVSATGEGGESDNSNQASAATFISPPQDVAAAPDSDTEITVTWAAVAGALSYNVKRSTADGGPYSTIATGVTDLSYPDSGLTAATEYFYVVSATGAGGEGADSDQASATTGFEDSPDNYANLWSWVDGAGFSSGLPWPGKGGAHGWVISAYSGGGVSNLSPLVQAGPPPYAQFFSSDFNNGSKLFPDAGDLILVDTAPYTVIAICTIGGDSTWLAAAVEFNCQVRAGRSGANVLSAFDQDTEAISSPLVSPQGALRMLTWTRTGGVMSFFEGDQARGTSFNAAAHTMRFGVMGACPFCGTGANGGIYEFCIYSGAIGATAIASLYNNYFKVRYPSLS